MATKTVTNPAQDATGSADDLSSTSYVSSSVRRLPARTMGQGDRHKSDQVAVEAMRSEMDSVPIDGTVVIGEGERDEAPMLAIGEKVGMSVRGDSGRRIPGSGHRRRSARRHEPLRDWCAQRARRGGVRRAAFSTRLTSTWRSSSSARAPRRCRSRCAGALQPARDRSSAGRRVQDLVVIVLDRPRHEKLIEEIRETGARIRLIGDGDLSAGMPCWVAACMRSWAPAAHLKASSRRRRCAVLGGDFRPPRGEHAGARGAVPCDGHHRLQEGLPLEGPRVGSEHRLRRDGRHRWRDHERRRFFGDGVRTTSLVMRTHPHRIRFIDNIHVRRKPGKDGHIGNIRILM